METKIKIKKTKKKKTLKNISLIQQNQKEYSSLNYKSNNSTSDSNNTNNKINLIIPDKTTTNNNYNFPLSIYFSSSKLDIIPNLTTANTEQKHIKLYYKMYKNPSECLTGPLKEANFTKTKSLTKANLIWKLYEPEEMLKVIIRLNKFQRYNHFPKTFQLGRKDYLWKNYCKLRKNFPTDYNYIPQTYILPNEKKEFINAYKMYKNINTWIVKPVNSSRGRGVHLLTDLNNFPKDAIVSKYIQNPHIINNKKYDLRLYVLITSFTPLKIYLHPEGLVRFASENYTKGNKDNIYVHLTNYSINKTNKNIKNKIDNIDVNNNNEYNHKWTLEKYKQYFVENNLINEYEMMFEKIKDIIVKSIITISEETGQLVRLYTRYRNTLFELYGFDILIDEKYNPWLCEINTNPSTNCDSDLDLKVKTNLFVDVFNLIGLAPFNIIDNNNCEMFILNKENEIVIDKTQTQIFENNKSKNNLIIISNNKDKSDKSVKSFNKQNSITNINNNVTKNIQNNNNSVNLSTIRVNICKDYEINKNFDLNLNKLDKNVYKIYEEIYEEYIEEINRKGNFGLLFPLNDNIKYYTKFMKNPGYENIITWKMLSNVK
jgi:tubulin polyglutamylase TTLL4